MSDFTHFLCKRLVLEKGYALWAADEAQYAKIVEEGKYHFAPPPCNYPEIAPLSQHFDFILVRADGMNFMVICIRDVTSHPAEQNATTLLDLFKTVGNRCVKYTGTISNAKMPVGFQVLYAHPLAAG